MAQGTRNRNTQVQVNTSLQPVALQQGNRGFQVGVSDRNVRAAQALQNAFTQGTQAFTNIQTQRNEEGRQQAVVERASGAAGPAEDNRQAGYLRAWDELDANFDFNAAQAEIPELLRGADWENLPEDQVVATINDYMNEQFGGLDPESPYAQTMAPKLLELEGRLITEHRTMQVEKIQAEQRSKIYSTTEADLMAARAADPDAGLDYSTLFNQTGTFFDGSAKKGVFLETIYNLAIENGDPSLIENMPEMINGVPTGSKDPEMLKQQRAAINSATSVAVSRAKAADDAAKAADKSRIMDDQMAIVDAVAAGQDPELIIESIRNNPEASFADITAAVNFGRSTLDENESQSPNLPGMDALWAGIYSGTATMTDVINAKVDGILGNGPQATAQFQTMLSTAQRMQSAGESDNSSAVGAFRTSLLNRFNPQMAGPMAAVDPTMMHIRNQAADMYNDLVLIQGTDPAEANVMVREKFEPLADQASADYESRIAVVGSMLTAPVLKNVLATGDFTDLAGFRGGDVTDSILNAVDAGELTEQEANELVTLLNN